MSDPALKPDDLDLHCPECDYNLTGATGDRCPWCGWEIDIDALAAAASERTMGRRVGAILACLVLGVGSSVAVLALARQSGRLDLADRVAVMGVLAAALGHVALAVLLTVRRQHWPLRDREPGSIIGFVAWLSIVAGVIGATSLLGGPGRARFVRGVPVSDAFDFLLAATLYTLPGVTLLIMKLVTFRHAGGSAPTPAGRGPGVPATSARNDGAPFFIDFAGRFPRGQVHVRWSQRPRPTTPALDRLITSAWETERRAAQQSGRLLYDGPLARLVRAEARAEDVLLELGPTSYREFIGTHLHNTGEALAAGVDCLAHAIGVSAVVMTADGYLALGRRSERVVYHGGFLHPFGGMVEQLGEGGGVSMDVFGSIIREAQEELGVKPHEVSDVVLIGLVRDRALHQPELIFDLSIRFTRDEVRAVFDANAPDAEHTAVEFVHGDPETVLAFLDPARQLTPVAEAAVLLHGRHHWGADWYEQTCYVRYGELPSLASPSEEAEKVSG